LDASFSSVHLLHTFKGLVHPKTKMLSSFLHPHVVPNLVLQEDILKNVWILLTFIIWTKKKIQRHVFKNILPEHHLNISVIFGYTDGTGSVERVSTNTAGLNKFR